MFGRFIPFCFLCLVTLGLSVCLTGISGCAAHRHQVQVSPEGKLLFEKLHLSCEFEREDNVNSFYPLELASGSDPAAISGEAPDPSRWNRGSLEIVYPIPESVQQRLKRNRDGAIVRIEYWKADPPQTVRTLAEWGWNPLSYGVGESGEEDVRKEDRYLREAVIPRYQLDFLLEDMTHAGFFESQEHPEGEAKIMVQIDEGSVSKNWDLEPRMREMIAKTLQAKRLERVGKKKRESQRQ